MLFASPILTFLALVLLSIFLTEVVGVRSPEYQQGYSNGRMMAMDLEEMIRLNIERNLPLDDAEQQLAEKKFDVRFVYQSLVEIERNWSGLSEEFIQKTGAAEYEKILKQLKDGHQGFFDGFNQNCSAFQLP